MSGEQFQRLIELAINGHDPFQRRILLLQFPSAAITNIKSMNFDTINLVVTPAHWRYKCVIKCLELMTKPVYELAKSIRVLNPYILIGYMLEEKEHADLYSRLLATISPLNDWPTVDDKVKWPRMEAIMRSVHEEYQTKKITFDKVLATYSKEVPTQEA